MCVYYPLWSASHIYCIPTTYIHTYLHVTVELMHTEKGKSCCFLLIQTYQHRYIWTNLNGECIVICCKWKGLSFCAYSRRIPFHLSLTTRFFVYRSYSYTYMHTHAHMNTLSDRFHFARYTKDPHSTTQITSGSTSARTLRLFPRLFSTELI